MMSPFLFWMLTLFLICLNHAIEQQSFYQEFINKNISLRTSHESYISVSDVGVVWQPYHDYKWECFRFIPYHHEYAIQSCYFVEYYLSATSNGSIVASQNIGSNELFNITVIDNKHNIISIQHHDKYLKVKPVDTAAVHGTIAFQIILVQSHHFDQDCRFIVQLFNNSNHQHAPHQRADIMGALLEEIANKIKPKLNNMAVADNIIWSNGNLSQFDSINLLLGLFVLLFIGATICATLIYRRYKSAVHRLQILENNQNRYQSQELQDPSSQTIIRPATDSDDENNSDQYQVYDQLTASEQAKQCDFVVL